MRTLTLLLLPALAVLLGPAATLAGDPQAPRGAARIQLAFKLDPRLSGPTYGGERWVSPPTYSGASAQDTVEIRAHPVDALGRPVQLEAEWSVSDAGLVTVAPSRGAQVRITVKRAGRGSVTVKAGGVTRTLTLTAAQPHGALQVEITQ
jgi:hypothetical protein